MIYLDPDVCDWCALELKFIEEGSVGHSTSSY
jgi:hypothetical protein